MSTRMPRQTTEQSQTQTKIIVTSSSPQREKRKRGQRMWNKFPKGHTIVVEEVSLIGEPIQPDGVRAHFASTIGAAVQDILDCSIQHWKDVPDSEKTKI
jgi:hypothetical protein